MNAIEIYENADRKLNKSEITLGEYERMIDPLRNVISIPEGATNGDMIKAMFPNAWKSNYIDSDNQCTLYIDDYELEVNIDWWNAPYKGVEK